MTQPPVDPPSPEDQQPSPSFAPPTPYPAPPPAPQYPDPAYVPPPEQPPVWGAPGYGDQEPKPGTNGFAIAALVFGIIPICFLGVIFGIVALVQTSKTRQKGKGLAIAGIVLTGVWLVGAVTVGVVAGLDDADRDESGEIVKEGEVDTRELRVGDCFNGLNDVQAGDTIATVTALPCSKLHEAETFARIELEGSKYPGEKALQRQEIGKQCVDFLDDKDPELIASSQVGVLWIYPHKFSWSTGDKDLVCIAISMGRRTGSIFD